MMARSIRRSATALALFLGLAAHLALGRSAWAQNGPSPKQLLEDFIFYVNTANLPLAAANATALLESGIEGTEFVGLVEDSPELEKRFDQAYRRALYMPELEDLSARLWQLYEGGRKTRARDPAEIMRNIGLLKGSPRQQLMGSEFLREAGEYAVPYLLEVLRERRDQALEAEIIGLMSHMGWHIVAPLSEALLRVNDEQLQIDLARLLGLVEYPAAAPYLAELHYTTGSEQVREAAERSLRQIGYRSSPSVAALYRELGERFYAEPRSLTSYPGEEHQLLWSFDPAIGLQPTAIRTEVFHEARVMRLAARALEIDPQDTDAIALWVAANFSRQLDQNPDYDNPAYSRGEWKDAMYYAVAAGPVVMQRVLARALEDRDTRLARLAIETLSMSAGGNALVGSGERALVDALTYPERRVRYEAALAIARAQPRDPFSGADQVVPILASIIGDASSRHALVIAGDLERQQAVREVLEGLGYRVLPPVSDLGSAFRSIAEVSAIDVIVTDLTTPRTLETINEIRSTARLSAAPVVAMMPTPGVAHYVAQFDDDPLTQLSRTGLDRSQLEASIVHLVDVTVGEPIDEAEAERYSLDALSVLRDLAIGTGAGGRGAFDIADASVPLEEALGTSDGEVLSRVAEVLSYIGLQRGQIALMDAAIDSFGVEREELLQRVIDSAKRFGNLLEQRHIRWIMELAEEGEAREATTAAALIGALNLPNDEFVPLILGGNL